MARPSSLGRNSRYTDLYTEPIDHLLIPIKGYDDRPASLLIQAVKPIAHFFNEIEDYVLVALHNCENPTDDLNQQESAAIQLYTMEFSSGPSLYTVLNDALRAEVRNNLKPWFPYLQLLLRALHKLPSKTARVWRGIKGVNLSTKYTKDTKFAWWGVSSCTIDMTLMESEKFLGKCGERTLFSIDCINGKSIVSHSFYGVKENEMILMPGSYFQVVGHLNPAYDLYIIELKEIAPPMILVKPPSIQSTEQINLSSLSRIPHISYNAKWSKESKAVMSNLSSPCGVAVDPKTGTVFVTNYREHCIRASRTDENKSTIVAGGNGRGSRLNQLDRPTDVLVDYKTNSILIADCENRRIVRWSLKPGTTQGEVVIDNIACHGLAMDDQGNIYVTDVSKNEVRRFSKGDKDGVLVAGGNGRGDGPHQLNYPVYVAIDIHDAVYVSDNWNHRVVKWPKGAKEGIIVAGGRGEGSENSQIHYPEGIKIDKNGTIYVSDYFNNRISRWWREEKNADIILKISRPRGLCFDISNNLYVTDDHSSSVKLFSISN